eukprot:scpid74445/ scgid31770/ 
MPSSFAYGLLGSWAPSRASSAFLLGGHSYIFSCNVTTLCALLLFVLMTLDVRALPSQPGSGSTRAPSPLSGTAPTVLAPTSAPVAPQTESWRTLAKTISQAGGVRRICGYGRAVQFSTVKETRAMENDTLGAPASSVTGHCKTLHFTLDVQDAVMGTVVGAELHFNLLVAAKERLLDRYTFLVYHILDGSGERVLIGTDSISAVRVTGLPEHICLDVRTALRAVHEKNRQNLTLAVDIVINGQPSCDPRLTNSSDMATDGVASQPVFSLSNSASIFTYYHHSRTIPFFRDLFQAYGTHPYRAIPPPDWDTHKNELCRVHRFTLDITAMGAIAPRNLTFGVCAGSCQYPIAYPTKDTHNSRFRSLLIAYDQIPAAQRPPPPCCSPVQNARMQGQTVTMRRNGKLVFTYLSDLLPKCGCF